MARAHAANASLHAQAVRGLARSLTRPAYQRLLEAEPLLREAIAPPPPPRVSTKPTKGARERRLADKRRRAQVKRQRRYDAGEH